MHWRREWQPTPVFLLGESQGQGNLVGCRLWGSHKVRYDWSNLAAVFNIFRVVEPSPQSSSSIFSSFQKKPIPIRNLFYFSTPTYPIPWQPLNLLCFCKFACFHTFPINRIFCDWLLPLNIVFSRSVHVEVCVGASFLFYGEVIFHIEKQRHYFANKGPSS